MPFVPPNLHFSNEKSTILINNRYFFNERSWRGLGVILASFWGGTRDCTRDCTNMFQNMLEHVEVSNIKSIKHTINQIKETNKEKNKTKKKPYIENYATPDRPPPAAARPAEVKSFHGASL